MQYRGRATTALGRLGFCAPQTKVLRASTRQGNRPRLATFASADNCADTRPGPRKHNDEGTVGRVRLASSLPPKEQRGATSAKQPVDAPNAATRYPPPIKVCARAGHTLLCTSRWEPFADGKRGAVHFLSTCSGAFCQCCGSHNCASISAKSSQEMEYSRSKPPTPARLQGLRRCIP
jgi:hypothetical protein